MKFFIIFYSLIILQRISELFIAKRNERNLKTNGAVEYDKGGYRFIVFLHVTFLISFLIEKTFLDRTLNQFYPILISIFVLTQFLRYWSIISLGANWNTKILVIPNRESITKGPYKYIRHPNYVAVIIEIAVIPLVFSCYITSLIFSIVNLITLNRRIRIEEKVLGLR